MISLKIDVTKLDKTRFHKGAKGIYCDLVLFEKPNEYGDDGFCTQSLKREERDSGERMPILGNWRTIGTKKNGDAATPQRSKPTAKPAPEDDEIPF
jgi:hypothetical protein